LSTDLNTSTRIGFSLRSDSGRFENQNEHLNGLGDLRKTLRGNLFISYRLDPEWSVNLNYQPDLLGRKRGASYGFMVSHTQRLSQNWLLNVTTGLNGIDRQFAQSYFGVTSAQSARSGLPQYSASASLRDVSLSASLNYRVTDHWTALGRLSVTQLLGDAAASPIALSKGQFSIMMGLGYRFF
jgi:outer membrane protein